MARKALSRKKITLNEFKAWLEGVEELQPDDWHPDANQWKLIRNKVNNIKIEVIEKEVPEVNNVTPAVQPRPTHVAPAPVAPSSIPTDVVISEPSPQAKKLLTGDAGKHTTPDIDTSGGYGDSPFK